jgi:hypothetical protein
MTYVSRTLLQIVRMADGPSPWNRYQNDLWHWIKHARPLLAGGVAIPAEMPDVLSEHDYLKLAQEICKRVADNDPASEVKIRETTRGDTLGHEFLIWYHPPGAHQGLFLVIRDCGAFGELVTMFPPVEGRNYYDQQEGQPMH